MKESGKAKLYIKVGRMAQSLLVEVVKVFLPHIFCPPPWAVFVLA